MTVAINSRENTSRLVRTPTIFTRSATRVNRKIRFPAVFRETPSRRSRTGGPPRAFLPLRERARPTALGDRRAVPFGRPFPKRSRRADAAGTRVNLADRRRSAFRRLTRGANPKSVHGRPDFSIIFGRGRRGGFRSPERGAGEGGWEEWENEIACQLVALRFENSLRRLLEF